MLVAGARVLAWVETPPVVVVLREVGAWVSVSAWALAVPAAVWKEVEALVAEIAVEVVPVVAALARIDGSSRSSACPAAVVVAAGVGCLGVVLDVVEEHRWEVACCNKVLTC